MRTHSVLWGVQLGSVLHVLPKCKRQRPLSSCQTSLAGFQAHPFMLGLHPLCLLVSSRVFIWHKAAHLARRLSAVFPSFQDHIQLSRTQTFSLKVWHFFPDISKKWFCLGLLRSFSTQSESCSSEQSLLTHHRHVLVRLRLHSGLYLSIFASNLLTLRACLGFAGFRVMRQPDCERLCHSLACSCQQLLSPLCSQFCTTTFDFCFSYSGWF